MPPAATSPAKCLCLLLKGNPAVVHTRGLKCLRSSIKRPCVGVNTLHHKLVRLSFERNTAASTQGNKCLCWSLNGNFVVDIRGAQIVVLQHPAIVGALQRCQQMARTSLVMAVVLHQPGCDVRGSRSGYPRKDAQARPTFRFGTKRIKLRLAWHRDARFGCNSPVDVRAPQPESFLVGKPVQTISSQQLPPW